MKAIIPIVFVFMLGWWMAPNGISEDDYIACEDELDNAVVLLEEANEQLVDANSYAWSSYEEMGEVLDNLYEVY